MVPPRPVWGKGCPLVLSRIGYPSPRQDRVYATPPVVRLLRSRRRTFLLPSAYVVRREGNSFTLFVCPHRGGGGVRVPPPRGGTQVRYPPRGGTRVRYTPRGGTQVRYPPGGVPGSGTTPPGGVPRSGTPPRGGVPG